MSENLSVLISILNDTIYLCNLLNNNINDLKNINHLINPLINKIFNTFFLIKRQNDN